MRNLNKLYTTLYSDLCKGVFFKIDNTDNVMNFLESDSKKLVYYVNDEDIITKNSNWDLKVEKEIVNLYIGDYCYTVMNYVDGKLHVLNEHGVRKIWTRRAKLKYKSYT